MKKLIPLLFIPLALGLSLVGCQDESPMLEANPVVDVQDPVVQYIMSFGIAEEDIVEYPDFYLAEGDLKFAKDMALPNPEVQTEHYMSQYLVSPGNRSITVYLDLNSFQLTQEDINMGRIDITSFLPNAVFAARNAYNNLNTDIQFLPAQSRSTADIVIEKPGPFFEGGACGVAGFPTSAGMPYPLIYIFPETGNNTQSKVTETLVHELGHCIGLRHTNGGNESPSPIYIPTTPLSDGSSVMNDYGCGSNWNGFSSGDVTAINCLYGPNPCIATCDDGIQNGNETGVDCGGSCDPCPTCNDGIQNGNETGVDCGGSCPACTTCNDGIKNGDETCVDCGGSCGPCALPATCTSPPTPTILIATDGQNYLNASALVRVLGGCIEGYEWSVSGGFIISGQGTNQISIGPDCPSGNITITVRAYEDSQSGRCYSSYGSKVYNWTGPCFN